MPNNKYSAGIILLLAGIVILLGKWGVFSFLGAMFWPLLVLIPGILLHVLYFGRMLPATVLVPGGMLIVYTVLFIFCNIFGWKVIHYLWPVFLLGIAVGLYEYYLLGNSRTRAILTTSLGLGGAAIILIILSLVWSWGMYAVAIVLIAAGGWMTFAKRSRW
ncbi:hypothetical protein [Paenibacillus protaetiae]|uniref:DUF5668 domain-containing protein n=1 Tax=Paenibacillus protaetiae TaxID=2509456 RepID=A0A4V0YEU2_9BACL|nr:hypothetical protein [Paenibacillus protaetiae]QAY65401.1 hypothetical protein ET464_02395 [Paenibacillus protaetiae]